MNNQNNDSKRGGSQVVLSYELLALLRWLVDYHEETLKTVVSHALSAGLHEEIQKLGQTNDMTYLHELQHSVSDFLTTIESLLAEVSTEQALKNPPYKDLVPTVENIDGTLCDQAIVEASIEKAASTLEMNPKANPKEVLFKELLRNWKPIDSKLKH